MAAIRETGDTPYVIGSIEEGEKGVSLYAKSRCDGIRRWNQSSGDFRCSRRREDHRHRNYSCDQQQSRGLCLGTGEKTWY